MSKMKLNIKRILTIKRYQVIVGGTVVIVGQPSVNRLGYENYVGIILPQRRTSETDGGYLKALSCKWFTPYKGNWSGGVKP